MRVGSVDVIHDCVISRHYALLVKVRDLGLESFMAIVAVDDDADLLV